MFRKKAGPGFPALSRTTFPSSADGFTSWSHTFTRSSRRLTSRSWLQACTSRNTSQAHLSCTYRSISSWSSNPHQQTTPPYQSLPTLIPSSSYCLLSCGPILRIAQYTVHNGRNALNSTRHCSLVKHSLAFCEQPAAGGEQVPRRGSAALFQRLLRQDNIINPDGSFPIDDKIVCDLVLVVEGQPCV